VTVHRVEGGVRTKTRPDHRTTRAPGAATAGDSKGEENEMVMTMATTIPPTAAVRGGNRDRDNEDKDVEEGKDTDDDDTCTRMAEPYPPPTAFSMGRVFFFLCIFN
jgi:hypothetical protein